MSRSANGDTIGFDFLPTLLGTYPPASRVLVIQTDATAYSTGGIVTAIGSNGSSVTFDAFRPSVGTVPEAGSAELLAWSIVAIACWTFRGQRRRLMRRRAVYPER